MLTFIFLLKFFKRYFKNLYVYIIYIMSYREVSCGQGEGMYNNIKRLKFLICFDKITGIIFLLTPLIIHFSVFQYYLFSTNMYCSYVNSNIYYYLVNNYLLDCEFKVLTWLKTIDMGVMVGIQYIFNNSIVKYLNLNNLFNVNLLFLVLSLFSVYKLLISKTINNMFFFGFLILSTQVVFLFYNGIEPISYFFFLNELSGMFLIFLVSLLKKKKTWGFLNINKLLFIFLIVFIQTNYSYNSYIFFNYYTFIFNNHFNDFLLILTSIIFNNVFIILLIFIIYTYSLFFIVFNNLFFLNISNYLYKTIKDNFNIFTKNFKKKWKNI